MAWRMPCRSRLAVADAHPQRPAADRGWRIPAARHCYGFGRHGDRSRASLLEAQRCKQLSSSGPALRLRPRTWLSHSPAGRPQLQAALAAIEPPKAYPGLSSLQGKVAAPDRGLQVLSGTSINHSAARPRPPGSASAAGYRSTTAAERLAPPQSLSTSRRAIGLTQLVTIRSSDRRAARAWVSQAQRPPQPTHSAANHWPAHRIEKRPPTGARPCQRQRPPAGACLPAVPADWHQFSWARPNCSMAADRQGRRLLTEWQPGADRANCRQAAQSSYVWPDPWPARPAGPQPTTSTWQRSCSVWLKPAYGWA